MPRWQEWHAACWNLGQLYQEVLLVMKEDQRKLANPGTPGKLLLNCRWQRQLLQHYWSINISCSVIHYKLCLLILCSSKIVRKITLLYHSICAKGSRVLSHNNYGNAVYICNESDWHVMWFYSAVVLDSQDWFVFTDLCSWTLLTSCWNVLRLTLHCHLGGWYQFGGQLLYFVWRPSLISAITSMTDGTLVNASFVQHNSSDIHVPIAKWFRVYYLYSIWDITVNYNSARVCVCWFCKGLLVYL